MSMLRGVVVAGLLASWCAAAAGAAPVDGERLRTAARAGDWKAIEAMGPSVLPELARIYRGSSVAERAQIAQVFYNLGWSGASAEKGGDERQQAASTDQLAPRNTGRGHGVPPRDEDRPKTIS